MKESLEGDELITAIIENLLNMIEVCTETKESDELELELGGENMGDKVVVTVKFVENKNSKSKVLN